MRLVVATSSSSDIVGLNDGDRVAVLRKISYRRLCHVQREGACDDQHRWRHVLYFFCLCHNILLLSIDRNGFSVVGRGEQDETEDAPGCCGFKKAAPGSGAGFPVLCFLTSVTLNSRHRSFPGRWIFVGSFTPSNHFCKGEKS